MSVEFIRLKINRRGKSALLLNGSVVIDSDGAADSFGDTVDMADEISRLLERVDVTAPMRRVTLDDLCSPQSCANCGGQAACQIGDCVRVDSLRIGGDRIIGPLLLRAGQPVAVGGAIDSTIAAILGRELRAFVTARQQTPALRRAA